jgi:hypothetical protein
MSSALKFVANAKPVNLLSLRSMWFVLGVCWMSVARHMWGWKCAGEACGRRAMPTHQQGGHQDRVAEVELVCRPCRVCGRSIL